MEVPEVAAHRRDLAGDGPASEAARREVGEVAAQDAAVGGLGIAAAAALGPGDELSDVVLVRALRARAVGPERRDEAVDAPRHGPEGTRHPPWFW